MNKVVMRLGVITLLTLFFVVLSSDLASAAPPSCGDGKCIGQETCSSCTADCGVCPAPTAGTSTTTSGGGVSPVTMVIVTPVEPAVIARGTLRILAEGYVANHLDSDIRVVAESELFGEIPLVSNFENRGSGIYGANVTFNSSALAGEYRIIVKGEKGTHNEQEVLITINPEITIDTSIKEAYHKGERIDLSGLLTYFDDRFHLDLNASTIFLEINAANFLMNKSILVDSGGRFSDSFLISYAEPSGVWKLRLHVTDAAGNTGTKEFKIDVSTLPGVAYYTITFLSPQVNTEFVRDSSIPITVEVSLEGKLVEGARVDFRTPNGKLIQLNEINPGTYSTQYKLALDEPLGPWYLGVQAVKTVNNVTRAGGNRIFLSIIPAEMNLVLKSPAATGFFTGQKVDFEAEFRYTRGTPVLNGKVFLLLGEKEIKLEERGDGLYTGSYVFTAQDVGVESFVLNGRDIYSNTLPIVTKSISIKAISGPELYLRLFFYNIFLRYWYLFLLIIILSLAYTRPFWMKAYLTFSLKRSKEEEKRIIEMEKHTQRDYFKTGVLTHENYEKLMHSYKVRLANLQERNSKLKQKLETTLKLEKKRSL